jgi:hypothetical protein
MRAYEFITEDRDSMLAHIKQHYNDWDLGTFGHEFDRLAQTDISDEWKEQIHNLIMNTAFASRASLQPEFKDDPDREDLNKEYIELAEKIKMYYALRV